MSILSYTLSFDTFINTLCINKGVKSQRYHFQDSADPKQEAISNMVFALVPRLIQGSMGHRYVYIRTKEITPAGEPAYRVWSKLHWNCFLRARFTILIRVVTRCVFVFLVPRLYLNQRWPHYTTPFNDAYVGHQGSVSSLPGIDSVPLHVTLRMLHFMYDIARTSNTCKDRISRWLHDMETFSVILGPFWSESTGEFP